MLPLREENRHAMTIADHEPPYFDGRPCSNWVARRDVDLGWVRQARQKTTADLQAKARAILIEAGLPPQT